MNVNETEPGRLRTAIFRHTLYLPSEQFIPLQAAALSAEKLMVARDVIENVPDDMSADHVSISSLGRSAVLRHTLAVDPQPLVDLLAGRRLQLLHAHFGVEGMYSISAARRLEIPHVTTLHGFDVSLTRRAFLASRRPAWIHFAVRRRATLTSGSTLVCVSKHVQTLALLHGAKPENTVVIGTGVDTTKLSVRPRVDRARVVHVARLVEKKGTRYLIESLALVARAVPDVELRIVGDGPLRHDLEQLVADLGLENRVSFLGALAHEQVLEEIRDASLLCLPSVTAASGDQEGLGQVILEAGAIGRPVVATQHGGIVDGVLDGESGILVPERNTSALAEALVSILESPAQAEKLGHAARRFVVRNFDVHSQAQKLERLYNQLV